MVYIVASASIIIFITINVIIVLFRYVFLIGLVIVWLDVGDFESQSVKYFQSNRGLPREYPDKLANMSGERQLGPREPGDYAASVEA